MTETNTTTPKTDIAAMKTTMKEEFDSIVGQDKAKRIIDHWITGGIMGNHYLEPLILIGGLGYGKSRLLISVCKIVKAAFPERKGSILLYKNGADLGTPHALIDNLFAPFVHEKNSFVGIDEASEIPVLTQYRLRDAWQPDTQNKVTELKSGDTTVLIDPKRFGCCMATNEIDRIVPALRSRLKQIFLEKYTVEELGRIISTGASEVGLRFNPSSLEPLSASCRGSARDCVSIINDLRKLANRKNKNTISQDDVDEILKLRGTFPLGLVAKEIATLLALEDKPEGRQMQSLAALNGWKSTQQKTAESMLFQLDFMEVEGKRRITPAGKNYLAELRRRHFIGAKNKTSNNVF